MELPASQCFGAEQQRLGSGWARNREQQVHTERSGSRHSSLPHSLRTKGTAKKIILGKNSAQKGEERPGSSRTEQESRGYVTEQEPGGPNGQTLPPISFALAPISESR